MKSALLTGVVLLMLCALSGCQKHENCFLCEYPNADENERICGGVEVVPQAQSDCVAAGGRVNLTDI